MFAESHLCWCFKLTCQGVEVAGVPFSYTPCSRTSSLWQLGSSSSLNCRARFTTGMCWPPCGPRPLPHKQKEAKLNPRRLCRAQTGSMVVAECGKEQVEGSAESWGVRGTAGHQRQAQKQRGDEKPNSPQSPVYRITWRTLESGWISVLQGELGQMKIGKSRCLSNLCKRTRLKAGTLSLSRV